MAAGNLDLLPAEKFGLICSSKCPGSIILKTYDYVRELRDNGVILAGGFHSPMEKACLGILLRGRQPIVICPARSIDSMRIQDEWTQAFDAGRLLFLSNCAAPQRRMTQELAMRRNAMIAAISRTLLIPHAARGSKTLDLCRNLLHQGRALETFDDRANTDILNLGATAVGARNTR
jgi:predicted Rossmann fold nucleotide-binding protein DprA/Smf involved in DNA uptake